MAIGFLLIAAGFVQSATKEKPLKSQCPGLIETHIKNGIPAHIRIKCKDQIK
jgi:hypothetical protein